MVSIVRPWSAMLPGVTTGVGLGSGVQVQVLLASSIVQIGTATLHLL